MRQRLRRLFSRAADPDDEDDFGSSSSSKSKAVSDDAAEEKIEKRPLADPPPANPAPTLEETTPREKSHPEKLPPAALPEESPREKNLPEKISESGALEKRRSKELARASGKLERRSSSGSGRFKKSWRRVRKPPIRLIVILAAIPAILYYGRIEHRIAGHFHVLPIQSTDVRADIEGIIERVAVREGDRVRENDLIAALSDRDLRPELAKVEAHIQQMRSRLNMMAAGPTAMEIEVAKAAVARADESIKYAQGHAGRNQQLFNEQLISRRDLELTQEQVALAENQRLEALSKLNVLLQGTRPEEIAATKSEIEGLETQRRQLEDQLRRLNIYSVASGVVSTPDRQLKDMRRQLVKKGDLIAKIYDPQTMTAEIVISEKEIMDIKIGQKVALKALAYPDLIFEGTVTGIGVAAQGTEGSSSSITPGASLSRSAGANKSILVLTQLENHALLLKPEMTGYAKISCGEKRLFDMLRWRLARIIKVEFWSWW